MPRFPVHVRNEGEGPRDRSSFQGIWVSSKTRNIQVAWEDAQRWGKTRRTRPEDRGRVHNDYRPRKRWMNVQKKEEPGKRALLLHFLSRKSRRRRLWRWRYRPFALGCPSASSRGTCTRFTVIAANIGHESTDDDHQCQKSTHGILRVLKRRCTRKQNQKKF